MTKRKEFKKRTPRTKMLMIGRDEPCKAKFPAVLEPSEEFGKYSIQVLIPKTSNDVARIKARIKKAYLLGEDGMKDEYENTKSLESINKPLRDGNEKASYWPEYEGYYYLNANSRADEPPEVIDLEGHPITDPRMICDGDFVRLIVQFSTYNIEGNAGVNCILKGVQKVKDGEKPRRGEQVKKAKTLQQMEFEDDDEDEGWPTISSMR